jgi:hypothetical protein
MQVFCESIRETLGTDFYLVIKQIVAVVTFSIVGTYYFFQVGKCGNYWSE